MTETYIAKGRPVYTMRLGTSERRILEAAAANHGEKMSAYIRRVVLQAARHELGEDLSAAVAEKVLELDTARGAA